MQQADLKITALICTYNRADLLAEVLASLELQSIPQSMFEIVIIDDGSVDQTAAVVNAYEQRLPIRYFYQENSGLAAAKNYGVTQTRAPIVVFMDDDDIASARLLEELSTRIKDMRGRTSPFWGILSLRRRLPDNR
jgi:glycosyltransferase involved in cell wall biosynthesis